MKKIVIAVAILFGFSGGPYAQGAIEQLVAPPRESSIKAIPIPVPSKAKASDADTSVRAAALQKQCLKKVVAVVNKQHTLAEGSVYALRVVYNGGFAAALLVGHSDSTDATDYLVTLEKEGCNIKSIVWTNEGSGVEKYTSAERIENVLK